MKIILEKKFALTQVKLYFKIYLESDHYAQFSFLLA